MEHGGTHCFISPSFHFSVVCSWLHNIAYVSNIQLVTTNRFCCLSCRSSRCLPVLSPPSTPAGCGGASPPLHSSGKLESPVSGHTGGYLSSLVHRGIDEWTQLDAIRASKSGMWLEMLDLKTITITSLPIDFILFSIWSVFTSQHSYNYFPPLNDFIPSQH